MEKLFNYTFKSKDNFSKALLAAGTDGQNHDGNRCFEQLGLDIVGVVLSYYGLMKGTDYRVTATLKEKYCSCEHRQAVARRIGIQQYITCCSKESEKYSDVLAITLAAIIGAIYIDSDHAVSATFKVLEYIGFYIEASPGPNPRISLRAEALCLESTANAHPMATLKESVSTRQSPRDSRSMERASAASGNVHPRKKPAAKHSSPSVIEDWVDMFIQREFVKCHERELAIPEDSYYNLDIQKQIQRIDKPSSREVARKMLFFIASAQSIVMLKGIVQKWRAYMSSQEHQPPQHLTTVKRFEFIQGISQDIAGLQIMRRYHILDWFDACGGSKITSRPGFIQIYGDNSLSKRPGNPLNIDKADVTSTMMQEMFPDLQRSDPRYSKEYAAVTYYRKLGWRFNMLTKEFGRGILALLPCHDVQDEIDMRLSDDIIVKVPESTFMDVLSILNRSQGDTWKEFSAAALSLVNSTFLHPNYELSSSGFEDIEPVSILEHPKNSSGLLHILQPSEY